MSSENLGWVLTCNKCQKAFAKEVTDEGKITGFETAVIAREEASKQGWYSFRSAPTGKGRTGSKLQDNCGCEVAELAQPEQASQASS